MTLVVSHLLERQTLTRSRDKVPVDSLFIAKLEGRFLSLCLVERGQEMSRGLRHGLGRAVTPERRRQRLYGEETHQAKSSQTGAGLHQRQRFHRRLLLKSSNIQTTQESYGVQDSKPSVMVKHDVTRIGHKLAGVNGGQEFSNQ